MAWLRMRFDCGPAQVDAASDLLERFGATSVSIIPLAGDLFADAPGGTAYWPSNRLAALLAPDTDLDILLACLRNRVGPANIRNATFEAVADRNWGAEYRATRGPICFGDFLCICPSWAQPAAAEHVIFLDPGLAFGTGSHGTTALCLDWLVTTDLHGLNVIDYGCGSGILAMAAATMGARAVDAVDFDPEAVAVARDNVAKNGLGQQVRVSVCDEVEMTVADILIANILLQPLVELAPRFSALVKPRGMIVLSGILATQVEECVSAYGPWFVFSGPEFRDEWAMLHGTRSAAPAGRGSSSGAV